MKVEVDGSHIHITLHIEPDHEVRARLDAILEQLHLMESNIMTAIDDLKAATAAFITEGTSDIAALVAQINAGVNQDPAIVALTGQITDATAAMHKAFTDATGVPLPPVTPAA
jgi:hypothetical protein